MGQAYDESDHWNWRHRDAQQRGIGSLTMADIRALSDMEYRIKELERQLKNARDECGECGARR